MSDNPRGIYMRKIIVEAEVSLDGAMGGSNMDFWKQLFQFHSPDVQAYLDELLLSAGDLLMGRVTYQGFAAVWPTRQGKQADKINGMPKHVASRTLQAPLQWNAMLIEGDATAAIRKLKEAPGEPLVQYGVGELTHALLRSGLVDELRLVVFPFTFGEGPRAFERMGVHPLKLLQTQTFDSGAVALHYQPLG
jgi:dihydrofolate reductase